MKLSNHQRRMLAAAAARDDGHLFPLTMSIADKLREAACRGLLTLELVTEMPVTADDQLWRVEGDTRLGLVITPYARDLIAAEQDGVSLPDGRETPARSKIAQVLTLLGREEGVTLDEIGHVTGWLPHSMRAALTGLRKKGHVIDREQRDGVTVYRLTREG